MMPNQRLRVDPIMDELLLYGKGCSGLKQTTICVLGKSAGGMYGVPRGSKAPIRVDPYYKNTDRPLNLRADPYFR